NFQTNNASLASTSLTVDPAPPPTSFHLFAPDDGAETMFNDHQAVEVGTKFTSSAAGNITQLEYYRASADSIDTDVRQGHLWASDGTLLATVTFNSAPGASGWQVATLTTPVQIQAGATYV